MNVIRVFAEWTVTVLGSMCLKSLLDVVDQAARIST